MLICPIWDNWPQAGRRPENSAFQIDRLENIDHLENIDNLENIDHLEDDDNLENIDHLEDHP